jgi:hypothetical protein
MKNLIEILKILKYRKQIILLLRYSFDEVQEYRYLTRKEKQIIRTEREFYDIKSL